jgi:hypothetical protein
MAAFGQSFYGDPRPNDDEIINEVVQLILHGYLYSYAPSTKSRANSHMTEGSGRGRSG